MNKNAAIAELAKAVRAITDSLRKAHVKGYTRTSKTGKVSVVQAYEDKRKNAEAASKKADAATVQATQTRKTEDHHAAISAHHKAAEAHHHAQEAAKAAGGPNDERARTHNTASMRHYTQARKHEELHPRGEVPRHQCCGQKTK